MSKNIKTEKGFWDSYWDKRKSIKNNYQSLQITEIQRIFKKYLPVNNHWSVLEIGGANSCFLEFMAKQFHYQICSLDYSSVGNQATRAHFAERNIEIQIFERDLFSDLDTLPLFDLVYSLGFIEHFENPVPVIKQHLRLLKPEGILIIGIPNLTGIYQKVLDRTAPSFRKSHNLKIMNISSWGTFEGECRLKSIFKSYIGGFEPLNMKKLENKKPLSLLLYGFITLLTILLSFKISFLRKVNSRFLSGYIIGIYNRIADEV
jgi:2-polyprenyl-3-methyl-5-hydroxy-6-metoxy-1,4-benzoquinol methylase